MRKPKAGGTMADHMICIGFDMSDESEIESQLEQVFERGEQYGVDNGVYCLWKGNGEQVWLQLTHEGHFMGANPHFQGESRINVVAITWIKPEGRTQLDGTLEIRSVDTDTAGQEGVPMVVDLPNAELYSDLKLSEPLILQIAAFAHSIKCYESKEAFVKAQKEGESLFAIHTFIPSVVGRSADSGENILMPYAHISGLVVKTETRRNILTGLDYNWALVASPVGRIDVVWSKDMLPHLPPQGGVLVGDFWLSAIPANSIDDQDPK